MAQTLRLDEQIEQNQTYDYDGYSINLHTSINDQSDDTAVVGHWDGTSYLIVGLPVPANTPGAGSSTVYFRIRKFELIENVTCEILQGSTSKGSLTKQGSSSWVTWSFSVSLNDYSDLRVKLSFAGEDTDVSEVWVEVPDAGSGGTVNTVIGMGCAF